MVCKPWREATVRSASGAGAGAVLVLVRVLVLVPVLVLDGAGAGGGWCMWCWCWCGCWCWCRCWCGRWWWMVHVVLVLVLVVVLVLVHATYVPRMVNVCGVRCMYVYARMYVRYERYVVHVCAVLAMVDACRARVVLVLVVFLHAMDPLVMISHSVQSRAGIQRKLHMSHLVAQSLGDRGWKKHRLRGSQLQTAREAIKHCDRALYELWAHTLTPKIRLCPEILEDGRHLIVVCKVPAHDGTVVFHQMFPHSEAKGFAM